MDFPIITKEAPLYLASASERRRRLLEQVQLPFRSLPGDIEEDLSGEEPSFGTLGLAEKKARSIFPLLNYCVQRGPGGGVLKNPFSMDALYWLTGVSSGNST